MPFRGAAAKSGTGARRSVRRVLRGWGKRPSERAALGLRLSRPCASNPRESVTAPSDCERSERVRPRESLERFRARQGRRRWPRRRPRTRSLRSQSLGALNGIPPARCGHGREGRNPRAARSGSREPQPLRTRRTLRRAPVPDFAAAPRNGTSTEPSAPRLRPAYGEPPQPAPPATATGHRHRPPAPTTGTDHRHRPPSPTTVHRHRHRPSRPVRSWASSRGGRRRGSRSRALPFAAGPFPRQRPWAFFSIASKRERGAPPTCLSTMRPSASSTNV